MCWQENSGNIIIINFVHFVYIATENFEFYKGMFSYLQGHIRTSPQDEMTAVETIPKCYAVSVDMQLNVVQKITCCKHGSQTE